MHVREGGAEPLPSRQETAYGPPELGQRAQELAALPQRVPQFRNCEARARSSHSATAQARRAEEPEEVAALVANAQEFERIRAEYGTFARYIHLQERFRHVGPYTAEFYLHCVGRSVYGA